jgi:hypothetical protein
VQQVGLHWYHAHEETWAPGCDPFPEGYFGPIDAPDYVPTFLLSDAIHQFRSAVVYGTQSDGFDLKLSVSETGFPAVSFDYRRGQPLSSAGGIDCPRKDLDSSDLFQAGMLVRRMVQFRALGVAPVGWHAYISSTKNADEQDTWSYFTGMGLRRDVLDEDEEFKKGGFRRPGWYAMRRLAWLLSQSTSIEAVINTSYGAVVKLTTPRGIASPEAWEERSVPRRWDGVMVAWLDQAMGATSRYIYVRTDEVHRAPLVPEVTYPEPGTATSDENGWPSGESVNWTWDGWNAHSITRGTIDGQTWWRLTLRRASIEFPSPLGVVWRMDDASDQIDVRTEDDLDAHWSAT